MPGEPAFSLPFETLSEPYEQHPDPSEVADTLLYTRGDGDYPSSSLGGARASVVRSLCGGRSFWARVRNWKRVSGWFVVGTGYVELAVLGSVPESCHSLTAGVVTL